MFDLIEKLRQKPNRTKKLIAFLGALLFVGIIFVIWLSVILPDFEHSQTKLNDCLATSGQRTARQHP